MTYNRCKVCGGFLRTEAITIEGKRACRCTNQLTRTIPGQLGQAATGIMVTCNALHVDGGHVDHYVFLNEKGSPVIVRA